MFQALSFRLPTGETLTIEVRRALAAGATGRDAEKVRRHIARMAELGVTPPPHVPMLYPLMPTLVTNATDIGVIGTDSTPEVEAVVFTWNGIDYVTVGSDHTDRRIEAASSLQGKNSCPKVTGTTAWPLAEVLDHWDALTLRASCGDVLLQEGGVANLLPVQTLMDFVARHDGASSDGRLFFGGTVPTLASPPKGPAMITLELRDPVRHRALTHAYTVHVCAEYFRTPG
jgi:hypothetical protein